MESLIAAMILLISPIVPVLSADASACTNLAHILPIGASEIHVRQSSCDRWVRQMYFEGQPHDNLQEIIFSSNFTNTKVDDQYEKYTSDHRWFWASSKQDILIHEYIIDSFDKSSGITSFTTASESFSLSNEVVKVSGQIQVLTRPKVI